MKKTILRGIVLLTFLTATSSVINAQAPAAFNYQGVARHSDGTPLVKKAIRIEASIVQDSTNGQILYTETQAKTTTQQGYFSIVIGRGSASFGVFSSLDWTTKNKFLKISIDTSGGDGYQLSSNTQLLSVPYALYAKNAGNVKIKAGLPLVATLTDSIYINKGTQVGDLISWDGYNWVAKQPVKGTGLGDTSITLNNIQPYLALNYCIAMEGIFPSRNGSEPFLGEIELFGFNFTPRGWQACDGSLLSISQNTALFSLLGTYYGGNGVNTFAVPDLRGRTPINIGQGPGLSTYTIGQQGGTESSNFTIHR